MEYNLYLLIGTCREQSPSSTIVLTFSELSIEEINKFKTILTDDSYYVHATNYIK